MTKRFRPTRELRDAHPGCILVRVVRGEVAIVLALPDTEENRAKSFGPVPFEMMDGATFFPEAPPRTAPFITGDVYLSWTT